MSDAVPAFRATVVYSDPRAAIGFLKEAFGFELALLVEGEDGAVAHCRMRFDDSQLLVGREWVKEQRSPLATGGVNTQTVSVQLRDGIDEHFARAVAAGATVDMEPQDQWYGDRCYLVRDPEGHVWSFSQTIRDFTVSDTDARGVSVKTFPQT